MHKQIYEKLRAAARSRGYITYSDISPLASLDMDSPADREKMSQLLAEIAQHEENEGRPMLTALVIHRTDNIPGEGFFTTAAEFGRFQGGSKLSFWIDSLNEVHNYWQAK